MHLAIIISYAAALFVTQHAKQVRLILRNSDWFRENDPGSAFVMRERGERAQVTVITGRLASLSHPAQTICRYLCVRVILGDFVQIVGDLGEGRVLVPGGDLISLQEIRAYREAVVLAPTSLDRFVSFVKMYRLRLHREPGAVQRVLGTFAVGRAPSEHNFGKLVCIGRQRTSLNRCWTPVPLQRHSNCGPDVSHFCLTVVVPMAAHDKGGEFYLDQVPFVDIDRGLAPFSAPRIAGALHFLYHRRYHIICPRYVDHCA